MTIFLLGSSLPTGRMVLKYLLTQGHQVKALVESPREIDDLNGQKLETVQGDVFDENSYSQIMKGCDMVIYILGIRKFLKAKAIYSKGGELIIKNMRLAGIKKIIAVTSGRVQKDNFRIHRLPWFYKYIGMFLAHDVYRDMMKLEEILEDSSDLDWVVVRPPNLTDGPLTLKYKVDVTFSLMGTEVSREDLAYFIVKQVHSNNYVHKKVVISY